VVATGLEEPSYRTAIVGSDHGAVGEGVRTLDAVTAADVLDHFVATPSAAERFAWWRDDDARADVVPAVMAHESRVVVSATLAEVEQVCRSTGHALGDVRKSDIRRAYFIRDWTTAFAASHVFHFITERDGAIPTWQRFRQACAETPFREMLWDPAHRAVAECRRRDGVDFRSAHDAMRWRIGNFYYAFLKEQWTHAYLRECGVPVLQHPLADALYGVDGWIGDTVLSLFIGNDRFRTRGGGRKHRPSDFLADRPPRFTFVDIELAVERRFGVVHLPRKRALDAFVDMRR
jgi:hypothetical protein